MSCKIHPVVIFSILDHYLRRNEKQDRAIGTLLGVNHDGIVEIKNCFPVPHIRSPEGLIELDSDFHRTMIEQHMRADPTEMIVGWYSTGSEIDMSSLYIHNSYWNEIGSSPIHLLVDLGTPEDAGLNIKAMVSGHLSYSSEGSSLGTSGSEKTTYGFLFQPVELEFEMMEEERPAIDILIKAKKNPQQTYLEELGNLESSIKRLGDLLQRAEEYVKGVLEGKEKEDAVIGRKLFDALSAIPKIEAQAFEKMLNNSLTDLLMVVYLSNLTRVQIAIAEKLQSLPVTAQVKK